MAGIRLASAFAGPVENLASGLRPPIVYMIANWSALAALQAVYALLEAPSAWDVALAYSVVFVVRNYVLAAIASVMLLRGR